MCPAATWLFVVTNKKKPESDLSQLPRREYVTSLLACSYVARPLTKVRRQRARRQLLLFLSPHCPGCLPLSPCHAPRASAASPLPRPDDYMHSCRPALNSARSPLMNVESNMSHRDTTRAPLIYLLSAATTPTRAKPLGGASMN